MKQQNFMFILHKAVEKSLTPTPHMLLAALTCILTLFLPPTHAITVATYTYTHRHPDPPQDVCLVKHFVQRWR